MKILITGTAGFIGHHLALRLQKADFEIVGLDCINSYYDPQIKLDRLRAQGFDTDAIEYNSLIKSTHNTYFISTPMISCPNCIIS